MCVSARPIGWLKVSTWADIQDSRFERKRSRAFVMCIVVLKKSDTKRFTFHR